VGKFDPNKNPGESSEKTFELVVEMIDGFTSVEWVGQESLIKFILPDKTVYALWDDVKLPLTVEGRVETVRYDGSRKKMDARDVVAKKPMFVVMKK